MYEHIVRSIICSQFETNFGREAGLETHSSRTRAMQVKFSISPDYAHEDGYRNLTILIFGGGSNYIGVYAKVDWNVTANNSGLDIEWNEAEADASRNPEYVKGVTPWVCYGYHDSCWRDSVESILREFHDRISTIDSLFNGQTGWYKSLELSKEQIAEAKAIRKARYESNAVWQKLTDLEFKFNRVAV